MSSRVVGSMFGRVVGWLTAPLRALVSLDRWGEIFDTMSRNVLRASLTAFSVAWGVFVLVVLLGLGKGMENGMRSAFTRDAANAITVRGSKTSQPFGGFDVGRTITFRNSDYETLRKLPGVDEITGRFSMRGSVFGGNELPTRRGDKANSFSVQAVHPDALSLFMHEMAYGRFLSERDIVELRKSIVIGRPVAEFLFAPGESPIGEWISVGGVAFQVVGVFRNDAGADEERLMFVPVTTAQLAWNGRDQLNAITFTVDHNNFDLAEDLTDQVRQTLSESHRFAPDDPQAIRIFNNLEGAKRFSQLFFMISVFVVFIGGLSIGAGVIGVSNIMMITVKERTKEIGIRKALGATPISIVSTIVQEAIVLTAVAGLAGMALGIGVLWIFNKLTLDFIREPGIHLSTGLWAIGVLVMFGALAGFFPARSAARVNPIHSLRDQ